MNKATWQNIRRPMYAALVFVGFFFLLGYFEAYHVPRLKRWILMEVEKQSQLYSPIRVWPKTMDIHLFPLGATFYESRLLPQRELKSVLEPTSVQSLRVSLSTWALLKGQIRIGEIAVDGAIFTIRADLSERANMKPASLSLESLNQIPLDRIHLENVRLQVTVQPQNLVVGIENLNLDVENKFKTIQAELAAKTLTIQNKIGGTAIEADVESRFLLDDEGIYFSQFKAGQDQSQLHASGSVLGHILQGEIKNARAKVNGDLELAVIRRLVTQFIDPKKLPTFSGHLNFETDFHYVPGQAPRASFLVNTQRLQINQFQIGQALVKGQADENKLVISKATAQSNYGRIALEKGQLLWNTDLDFQSQLIADKLQLHPFLAALGIPKVPVYTQLTGALPCSGKIKNKFKITCQGSLKGQDFSVTPGINSSRAIVAFKEFGADGSVTIDDSAVQYNAKVHIGQSKGESSGIIQYKSGFKINYITPELNFADISDLARLKVEGKAALKGQTSGDSHSAIFNIKTNTENSWLSDFGLGRTQMNIRYNQGNLYFEDIDGQLGNSRYKGEVRVDLRKDQISVQAQAPFVDAQDLKRAFERKVSLPFQITGTGSANVKASGPFDFSRLSYEFNSALYRGTAANETFDQVQFNIVSRDGFVEARKVGLTKGRGQIRVDGNVKPTGMMNLKLSGRSFQIEQSEILSQLKFNISGNLDFDMLLTEHIMRPKLDLVGQLSQASTGDRPAQDSKFHFQISNQDIRGDGHFLGQSVVFDFLHQFDTNGGTQLKLRSKNWNFAQTFSIFSESLRTGSYQTNLTGEVNLRFPNKSPEHFSGEMQIQDIFFRSGRSEMKAPHPIEVTAARGIISANNFEILGDNTYIRLKSTSQEPQRLGLNLEGRVDLNLASLITPFLDDIRGILSFSFSLTGPFRSPTLAGSSYIENGFFRLKNFPHPLEQVSGDALFSHEKIIINAVKGRIGGGIFNANGRVQVNNLTDVAVDIKGLFSDAKFNVPEGFNTRGSGEFYVRGSWFPYTVGVNYNIDSGLIERKQAATEKSIPEVKPSPYLPKFLSAQRFSPIVLALDLNIRHNIPVKMTISQIDIRAEVNGQMKVTGPPETPLLMGKINVARGGKVNFRNNTFEIQNGIIDYRQAPPHNPNLNVQAESRVTAVLRNNETRDYDVDLRVLGTAAEPKISVSSEPTLSETELISLLTLGFISPSTESTSDQEDTTTGELTNTTYQLGSAFINEQLGISRVLEKQLGVRFEYGSSYDTTDKAEKHKFTLRKQWTPKFGTSASREIGKTNTNNVRAEYKLNKNLSVIGEWEGIESTGAEQAAGTDSEQNIFGLDLEYRVEFK